MRLFLSFLTFIFFVPHFVMAQNSKDPKPPKPLANMVSSGSQLFFLGQFEGMNGWALVRQGKPEFFYENKDRTAMIMGLLFNDEGDMVTMAQLKALHDRVGDDMYAATGGALPKEAAKTAKNEQTATQTEDTPPSTTTPTIDRPLTKAEKMYTDLLGANWITMNPDGKYDIFAFIDPDCPHCMTFINDVQPALTNDGIRIRVIPVGIREASKRKAALLLASSNPAEKLKNHAAGTKGALTAPKTIGIEAEEKNFNVMIKHGFDVTPIIVYRTSKGAIRMIRGRPANMEMIINDIDNN